MFYGLCLTCGRGYEYGGHLDSWCPACWARISLYCPKCLRYFDTKPSKSCPNCGEVFVKTPPPAAPKPAPPKPATPSPTAAPKQPENPPTGSTPPPTNN